MRDDGIAGRNDWPGNWERPDCEKSDPKLATLSVVPAQADLGGASAEGS